MEMTAKEKLHVFEAVKIAKKQQVIVCRVA